MGRFISRTSFGSWGGRFRDALTVEGRKPAQVGMFSAAVDNGSFRSCSGHMGDAPDVNTFMASKVRKHRRVARWNPLGHDAIRRNRIVLSTY